MQLLKWAPILAVALTACGEDHGPQPVIKTIELAAQQGQRIEINVERRISDTDCLALLRKHQAGAQPDGLVAVLVPLPGGQPGSTMPLCTDQMDGAGPRMNAEYATMEQLAT